MRIAAVTDIHGNLPALEAVVADLEQRAVDMVVNLGDNVSGPLLPRETAQFLMAQPWVHLAGNHERQLLAPGPRNASDEFARSQLAAMELAWLATLTPRVELTSEVLLCHGTPTSDVHYFLETVEPTHARAATRREVDDRLGDVRRAVVLCGHSHVPRTVRASNGTLIVNPGSVGLQAYDEGHPYRHVVELGSPHARYAIIEHRAGTWTVSHLAVPYAHHSMAELAMSRNRPEWARALATGYVT
jgi:putative phosphoesterase